ncbi:MULTISPECIES: hypothetical protein [Bradyrhizobium]|uniref:hypothetical protein n=1 Tax=Bradyrhizobium TaxID=374 RepID=UPI001456BDFE|nr:MULTISPECIES: hypothetical protein [Bradyrhizobium]MCP1847183.1 hypothetical protein [Bradyrhizobium sp. USDA 4541]MCP1911086.1 hypothetical protein [Bradyrhizobium elkanii]NLS75015.1 hypothetical protein [Bradyrhizobium brasilense]
MVGFPLLLVPLAVYNIIAFLMPGVSFTDPLIRLTLLSGEQWQITLSDMLLAAAVLLLLLEVIKGARPGAKYLTDHLLSLIVFGAAAAEFVLWPKFGNSTYGLLTLLALVDFISGIALRTRRRAMVAPAAPSVSRPQPEAPQPAPPAEAPTPRSEPAPVAAPAPAAPPPAAPVPSATSVAESVLLDQSAPKPTVTSPDLQPGGHPPSDTPQR